MSVSSTSSSLISCQKRLQRLETEVYNSQLAQRHVDTLEEQLTGELRAVRARKKAINDLPLQQPLQQEENYVRSYRDQCKQLSQALQRVARDMNVFILTVKKIIAQLNRSTTEGGFAVLSVTPVGSEAQSIGTDATTTMADGVAVLDLLRKCDHISHTALEVRTKIFDEMKIIQRKMNVVRCSAVSNLQASTLLDGSNRKQIAAKEQLLDLDLGMLLSQRNKAQKNLEMSKSSHQIGGTTSLPKADINALLASKSKPISKEIETLNEKEQKILHDKTELRKERLATEQHQRLGEKCIDVIVSPFKQPRKSVRKLGTLANIL
eukprot:PhF_6_TR30212/c0_g1_i1/m.44401